MAGIRIGGVSVSPNYVPYEKDLDQLWYVAQAGGSPVMVLDKAGVAVRSPVASPDFTQIAYLASGNLWVVNRDGTGDTEIAVSTDDFLYPDWNPDGTDIIFCTYDTGDENKIQRINPDGTGLTTVYTSSGIQAYRAVYNRDGSKIAFYDEPSVGNGEVWVIDADGSNPVQVGTTDTSILVEENAISWMHGSDVLAFGDGGVFASGFGKFYRVDADGSNLAEIAQADSTSSDRGMCPRRAWTEDDSTFVFQKFDNVDGHYTGWTAPAGGGADTQMTPGFGIFRLPPLVFGSRVYADGEDVPATTVLGLISALPDGSDQRVDDGPDSVRLEFPN